MNVTISADLAKQLGLAAVGDEAYLEVTEVKPDGSIVVMQEEESGEAEDKPASIPESAVKLISGSKPEAPEAAM